MTIFCGRLPKKKDSEWLLNFSLERKLSQATDNGLCSEHTSCAWSMFEPRAFGVDKDTYFWIVEMISVSLYVLFKLEKVLIETFANVIVLKHI